MKNFKHELKAHPMLRGAAKSAILALVGLTSLASCSDDPQIFGPPCTSSVITEKLQRSYIDKIDLVLAIDNSRSMADKQQILAQAVPDLVQSLMNPPCVDEVGMPVASQPSSPLDNCPPGSQRDFPPIFDIHLGVISSSIGGHGADSCPDVDDKSPECAPISNTTNNDHGHLLSRRDQCGVQQVPTYGNKGFLAWDPKQELIPPGESKIDDGMGSGIVPALHDMVIGAGQIGCGYESQLESIYRFLADPDPYDSIIVDNFKAMPIGTDQQLLAQRASFLRPDSLLAIVMLTDENDCSIKEYGQFYYVGQLRNGATPVRLPRARQECAKDPNDPCCKSCGQPAGGCPDDPTCKDPNGGTGPALLSDIEDNINLRCWDQKRRFGIDFLYPTDRYVQAFSSNTIPDREGNLVPNPIFSDLDPSDTNFNIRDSGLVFFAGIVGVPWQDIARDKTDLKKGFKDGNELAAPINANGVTTWEVILGDPAKNEKPLDPLMIETYQIRSGTNPITGDKLVDASIPNGNPINGHEWTIPNDDLQYACIFPLLPGTERDCSNPNVTSCDCTVSTNDNPLCAPNPNDGNAPTLQTRAKAYPGIRPLSVIRDLGSQGIVGSVCPAQLSDMSEGDFGYRAAVRAIRDRLQPAIAGQCLPQTLVPDTDGQVSCLIIEARNTNAHCDCDPNAGRQGIVAGTGAATAANQAKHDPLAANAGWDCFCEIPQATGAELTACQQDTSSDPMVDGKAVNAWCYVDAGSVPPTGNPEIVARCPDNEKRILRFVGKGEAHNGATLFITCGTEASTCE